MLGGGAWSFLVGGVNCLVNSDNERDLNLLNKYNTLPHKGMYIIFLKRTIHVNKNNEWKYEAITGL